MRFGLGEECNRHQTLETRRFTWSSISGGLGDVAMVLALGPILEVLLRGSDISRRHGYDGHGYKRRRADEIHRKRNT